MKLGKKAKVALVTAALSLSVVALVLVRVHAQQDLSPEITSVLAGVDNRLDMMQRGWGEFLLERWETDGEVRSRRHAMTLLWLNLPPPPPSRPFDEHLPSWRITWAFDGLRFLEHQRVLVDEDHVVLRWSDGEIVRSYSRGGGQAYGHEWDRELLTAQDGRRMGDDPQSPASFNWLGVAKRYLPGAHSPGDNMRQVLGLGQATFGGTEMVDGLSCYRLDVEYEEGERRIPNRESWWIAPARDYVVVKSERVTTIVSGDNAGNVIFYTFHAQDFVRLGTPAVWVPRTIVYTCRIEFADGVAADIWRWTLIAQDLHINEPVPGELLTGAFPSGTPVWRVREAEQYTAP